MIMSAFASEHYLSEADAVLAYEEAKEAARAAGGCAVWRLSAKALLSGLRICLLLAKAGPLGAVFCSLVCAVSISHF